MLKNNGRKDRQFAAQPDRGDYFDLSILEDEKNAITREGKQLVMKHTPVLTRKRALYTKMMVFFIVSHMVRFINQMPSKIGYALYF